MTAMRRDQFRAAHAYKCVREVPDQDREEYKIAVDQLGPAILRSGLAAALSFLERRSGRRGTEILFAHLAKARIPGLADEGEDPKHALPERARQLDLEDYMLASRELLLVAHWFKRAVQATFLDD